MDDTFWTQRKEDLLNDIIMHIYELTTPAAGMEDYIFFDKNEAMAHLEWHFSYIDFNDPDPDEHNDVETYHKIMEEIELMDHFIAFDSDDINDYYVDDYPGYIKDLLNKVVEAVEYHNSLLFCD